MILNNLRGKKFQNYGFSNINHRPKIKQISRLKIHLEKFLWHLLTLFIQLALISIQVRSLTMGFECFVQIPLCAQFVFSTVWTSVNGWLCDGDLYLKRFFLDSIMVSIKNDFFCHYCSQGPFNWSSFLRISGHLTTA